MPQNCLRYTVGLLVPLAIGLALGRMTWDMPPSLYDDPTSISRVKDFETQYASRGLWPALAAFDEHETGRFRPGYWLFQSLRVAAGGEDFHMQHTLHTIGVLAIVALLYCLFALLTRSAFAAAVGAALVAASPTTAANIVRMGTAEVGLSLTQAAGLLMLALSLATQRPRRARGWLLASCVFTIVSCSCKETAVGLVPAAALGYVWTRSWSVAGRADSRKWGAYLGCLIVAFAVMRVLAQVAGADSGSYTSRYQFGYSRMLANLAYEWHQVFGGAVGLLASSALLSLVWRNTRLTGSAWRLCIASELTQTDTWQLLGFSIYIGFALIQCPWSSIPDYLMLPCIAGAAVFVASEIATRTARARPEGGPAFRRASIAWVCLGVCAIALTLGAWPQTRVCERQALVTECV